MSEPTEKDQLTLPVRRTYTANEVAKILGISRTTAYACIKSGEIPSLRFRNRIVIPAHVIEDLISFGSVDTNSAA